MLANCRGQTDEPASCVVWEVASQMGEGRKHRTRKNVEGEKKTQKRKKKGDHFQKKNKSLGRETNNLLSKLKQTVSGLGTENGRSQRWGRRKKGKKRAKRS